MARLCVVCARGGSKGLPSKNIREFMGRPLIAHTIEAARTSGLFDAIAVSSDSSRILEVAGQFGPDFLIQRPDSLATDQAGKIPAIRHCLNEAEARTGGQFEIVADLDVTSPLRTVADIQKAIEQFEASGAGNQVSANPSRKSPYFNLVELDDQNVPHLSKAPRQPLVRRQDAPACFELNGSIYLWRRAVLLSEDALLRKDTRLFVMPPERSIDIDSEIDFELAGIMARRNALES